ncbi:MAG: UDP-N-acetylmuramate dehydrogenase [Anaerolineaceae bacterium]|nr:UDP-N-acetylmuramate dehydrogenase [Anaerolineaceae bacterium]
MSVPMNKLQEIFRGKLQENVCMANYTTIRAGGLVDGLLPINTIPDLTTSVQKLWELDVPFRVIGSGSNFLVSDSGFRGIVLLNHAHNLKIQSKEEPFSVFAESGVILGTVARQSALRGLTGMEWATSVPGTVGGAVYGNAGAHCSDINESLIMATILHPNYGIEDWSPERLGYQYRSSILKREKINAVILSALFKVQMSTRDEAWERIVTFSRKRQKTQPQGASFGSTFRNPEGDHAGRLIEAAGLKGYQRGNAMISNVHANFILNEGNATAADIYYLISLAKKEVKKQFNVDLVLEIELLGDFDDKQD